MSAMQMHGSRVIEFEVWPVNPATKLPCGELRLMPFPSHLFRGYDEEHILESVAELAGEVFLAPLDAVWEVRRYEEDKAPEAVPQINTHHSQ